MTADAGKPPYTTDRGRNSLLIDALNDLLNLAYLDMKGTRRMTLQEEDLLDQVSNWWNDSGRARTSRKSSSE